MSKSYNHTTRYYDLVQTMVKPYKILMVIVMLYRHVMGYHNLVLTMVSPYGLFAFTARFLDHAGRSYNLTRTMTRSHTCLLVMTYSKVLQPCVGNCKATIWEGTMTSYGLGQSRMTSSCQRWGLSITWWHMITQIYHAI